jgi:hypothetical protein
MTARNHSRGNGSQAGKSQSQCQCQCMCAYLCGVCHEEQPLSPLREIIEVSKRRKSNIKKERSRLVGKLTTGVGRGLTAAGSIHNNHPKGNGEPQVTVELPRPVAETSARF